MWYNNLRKKSKESENSMKNIYKILALALICIAVSVMLFGCIRTPSGNRPPVSSTTYTATFMVDGKISSNSIVNGGGAVVKPIKDPQKACHKFIGWSTERYEYVPYDFSKGITGNVTLYAYFEFDEAELALAVEALESSVVKVTHTYVENQEKKALEGVGIIYHIQNGYCYIVTNYHTVYANENQLEPKITVTDKEGNEFLARVFKSQNKDLPAMDKEYDLAVICFSYNGNVMKPIRAVNSVRELGESVFAIGTSKEFIATGYVTEYKNASVDISEELSSIDFEVYHHNVIPDSEVKESLLFNLDTHFLGITYYSENGKGYTISVEHISLFLNEYLYG